MHALQPHHIVDIFVPLDDSFLQTPKLKGGRPAVLRDSELVTILIWNCLTTVRQQPLKDIYWWVRLYHKREFPKMPHYTAFVAHCHRLLPELAELLQSLLASDAPVRIMDATMLPVSTKDRAKYHKVARGVADWGKNWQGWHFGFKLHASINGQGHLCGLAVTSASIYDGQMMAKLVNEHTKIAVGDGTYNASVMRKLIWEQFGTLIVAPVHPSQTKKLMAKWQHFMLLVRPKIESVFDYLKQHMHLVSSFPRSVNGYILHYVRILLGYQVLVLGQ